jgi:hypothetical protein
MFDGVASPAIRDSENGELKLLRTGVTGAESAILIINE